LVGELGTACYASNEFGVSTRMASPSAIAADSPKFGRAQLVAATPPD
jgi:hypothetical protein